MTNEMILDESQLKKSVEDFDGEFIPIGDRIAKFLDENNIAYGNYGDIWANQVRFDWIDGNISINLFKEMEDKFGVSWDSWAYSDGKVFDVVFSYTRE